MAFGFAHGAIQWLAADAATTVYTVSGLSFQPKALRFYWMGLGSASDTTSGATHSRRGLGFATGTTARRCVGSQDQDAAANMTCTTGYRDDCVAMTLTSTPAADGLLDLNSVTSDGFTLIVDDQAPADVTVFWEAWGGSDITVAALVDITEPASAGTVDYTVTGFASTDSDDQVVMFAGVQESGVSPVASRNDSGLCIGCSSGAAAAENILVIGNNDDGSASADCDHYEQDGECLGMIAAAGGPPTCRATLSQFNADGFRLNWLARAVTGRRYIALAIKGGQWRAGSFTIDNTTVGNTATVSGLPFAPIGISLMSCGTAENAAATSGADDIIMLGSASSTTSRRCMGTRSEHSVAAAEIDLAIEYDQVLVNPSESGGVLVSYDLDVMTSDGFRIIVDVTASAGTHWHGYLAFAGSLVVARLPLPTSIKQSVNRAATY